MKTPPRHAVITSFLSTTKDRFHEYNPPKTMPERLQMVSEIENVSGVEMVFPYEVLGDPHEMKRLLAKHSLAVAAINVNVKAEPEFRNGSLTAADPAVRAKAVEFIQQAKDYARAVGADKVTCCPLATQHSQGFSIGCNDPHELFDLLKRAAQGVARGSGAAVQHSVGEQPTLRQRTVEIAVKSPQKDSRDLGVELAAQTVNQFAETLAQAEGAAVRPVRRHGVERIHQADDFCAEVQTAVRSRRRELVIGRTVVVVEDGVNDILPREMNL